MTLLQRYVEAVKRYLPSESREDTAHELASLLQDELDDAVEAKGAPLDEAEIGEFLRRHGHPYQVAARYRKRRTLIGEAAYPLYKRVLALVLSILLLVSVLISLGRLNASADASAATSIIPLFINDVLGSCLFGFAIVTLGFHWFGERFAHSPRLWRFDPAALPVIDADWANIRPLPTAWSIVLLVLSIALMQALHYPWNGSDLTVQLNPIAIPYLLGLQAIVLGMLAVHVVNMFQRYWTRTKLYAIFGLRTLAALILLFLLPMSELLTAVVADRGAMGQAEAARFMEVWPGIWVKLFLVAVIANLAWGAWNVLRRAKASNLPIA
jgi:hypothetical protein